MAPSKAEGGFPSGPVVKNLPASAGHPEDMSSIPGREDPLEEQMATHSSILPGKVPRIEEPGRLQSKGLQRVGTDLATRQ